MASTRNNNMRSDYKLQQHQFEKTRNYMITPLNDTIIKVQYPIFGINYQSAPAMQLSNNSVDLESELYGIGSTNLIKPKEKVETNINTLNNIVFMERLEPIETHFTTLENQRPMFK
jgi:hypothetical protein|tara:strand:- start:101 stop:448 length:348 start_codon:yes stop_codon:yes gene_type:complete